MDPAGPINPAVMPSTFVPGVESPQDRSESALWFAFMGRELLLQTQGESVVLPTGSALPELTPVRTQFLGELDGRPCYSAELALEGKLPEGMKVEGLRRLYGVLSDEAFAIAGRAYQIIEWDRTHQYCGHCATPTTQQPHERTKRCPKCSLVFYPRLSPAVIMLIARGPALLLARAHRFPAGRYSILAGFVEPGESLEETVIREVREEVGIEIKDIRYFGSQPWPFPNSLMIGFTATYVSGEITPEPAEIADAAWFTKRNLPDIPSKASIARRMIDWFVSLDL
ncbi:NADH pyrophosphatase [Acaryochloris thomasi RCC1774]|uniref:NAD-capped RNA hydrolase NudC n=1 Tax=Acaryochloris thomasi RCC1774 TaxID=1764569 RepID=A0A2W1JKX6_9CYAN|nr:NAD(+) diphosphatase [Acaryochloris thomasi]PZD73846.1 NADH pyrophosphatase [Acaryochloris thomasi RCC1774]